MTLACLAFASGANAAEVFAPSQAAERLKLQYHCGFQPERALRVEPGAKAVVAVSRGLQSAVSPAQVIRNPAAIDASIPQQKCRSIASWIASQNSVDTLSYLRLEVRPESQSTTKAAQYQARRAQYQASPIEGVVAKTNQPSRPARGDTALMIKIGLLLGLAYLVFLTLWIWATRVRPRQTRPGRGI
jgi:hypothetical protein